MMMISDYDPWSLIEAGNDYKLSIDNSIPPNVIGTSQLKKKLIKKSPNKKKSSSRI